MVTPSQDIRMDSASKHSAAMSLAEQARLTVMIQRHLEIELRLGRSLESFNEQAGRILNESGIRGPGNTRIDEMQVEAETLQHLAREVRVAREALITRVQREFRSAARTLSEVIACLPEDRRAHLDRQRDQIRSIVVEAHGDFLQHQVALFYALDFHRKFLAGVLHSPEDAADATVYNVDGKSKQIPAGNLYRKSC